MCSNTLLLEEYSILQENRDKMLPNLTLIIYKIVVLKLRLSRMTSLFIVHRKWFALITKATNFINTKVYKDKYKSEQPFGCIFIFPAKSTEQIYLKLYSIAQTSE